MGKPEQPGETYKDRENVQILHRKALPQDLLDFKGTVLTTD